MDVTKDLNSSANCGDIWTEYGKISRKNIQRLADNKAYTAGTLIDLLRFVAPKTMQRAEAHFSHGIATDLDDPKYAHYRYWSNPLETKLPDAPGHGNFQFLRGSKLSEGNSGRWGFTGGFTLLSGDVKCTASLLEGRGLESGAHVDIMGNVALIEDIMRVAAGASAEDIGGDQVYSDILKMSEKVNIKL
ncbi:hypothetical protein Tco_1518818 [Tanacetum coccineum]